jgi:hypothetical protein
MAGAQKVEAPLTAVDLEGKELINSTTEIKINLVSIF